MSAIEALSGLVLLTLSFVGRDPKATWCHPWRVLSRPQQGALLSSLQIGRVGAEVWASVDALASAFTVTIYRAPRPVVVGMRVTGGGFHLPMSTSDFGAYMRINKLNGSLGAGSQLASLSFPGLSFWK
jgi:hypothetical protein